MSLNIFSEELNNKQFVSDCILETDLSLIIPDDYVNDINERLTLYKEIDQLSYKDATTSFKKRIKR